MWALLPHESVRSQQGHHSIGRHVSCTEHIGTIPALDGDPTLEAVDLAADLVSSVSDDDKGVGLVDVGEETEVRYAAVMSQKEARVHGSLRGTQFPKRFPESRGCVGTTHGAVLLGLIARIDLSTCKDT